MTPRRDSRTGGSGAPDAAAEGARLRRRYRADKRFKIYTIAAMCVAAGFLLFFLGDLVYRGAPALRQAEVLVPITYSEASVRVPAEAIPESYRDIVSRTRLRQIPREGQRIQLRVPVRLDERAARSPSEAIADVTLVADEFFGTAREEAPYEFGAETVWRLLGEPAMRQIAEAARQREAGAPVETELWLWASDATSHYLQYGAKRPSRLEDVARVFDQAGRSRRAFDVIKYGKEGTTREEWVLALSDVDQYLKGYEYMQPESYADPELAPLPPATIATIDRLRAEGRLRLAFNHRFFTQGDSKIPEAAGMRSAIIGSVYVLAIVFALCMPIGVMTAIYLEEFAPDNIITQTIEVNINNLAAIPSILFGVLGLAVLINRIGMPRSSALVGGATLALMTLPVIIISSRAALRAVPDSIRMAGHAMGASRWQVVLHHVLPLSVSGILTGSIIGIAQAMGETAPLIIVGLVAFVPDAPTGPTDATTVMPAQIFSWWGMPQRAFEERAALAIIILLLVLFFLNAVAVVIRARAERRW